jgi:16S rRNA processing protein RimM
MLRVASYAAAPASFKQAGRVFLEKACGEMYRFEVESAQSHRNVVLLKLQGLNTGKAAEGYRGARILVAKDSLGRREDEFFWYELIGLEVFLDTGTYLGRVAAIIPAAGHDIYTVRDGEREILLPATEQVIKEIALGRGKMIVTPPEGLLELNAI